MVEAKAKDFTNLSSRPRTSSRTSSLSTVSLRDLAPYGNNVATPNFENSNTSDDAVVNDCVSSKSNLFSAVNENASGESGSNGVDDKTVADEALGSDQEEASNATNDVEMVMTRSGRIIRPPSRFSFFAN